MAKHRLPTFFISHGGGPWPWMRDQTAGAYDRLEAALQAMPGQIGATPEAVLMVSAHWEAPGFTVTTHATPPMIYDYGGFPAHTYSIRYPAPGSPLLAERVRGLIEGAGLPAATDAERGFDHGMFSPMAVIYPKADMPAVQLSLKRGLAPESHLALGRAVRSLRDEGVLIIGSGLSYHNLRAMGPSARPASSAFDGWLQHTLRLADHAERSAQVCRWASAPAARQAHPREEHLLPLMVALGAAEQEAAECVYHEDDFMGGVAVSSFRFGAPD